MEIFIESLHKEVSTPIILGHKYMDYSKAVRPRFYDFHDIKTLNTTYSS